ncbi:MAG: hypothetical protein QOF62_2397 [Pyrinomonadaceae bacterium]|jgi:hypothetical protein|nr:hypothetical protein [Pyrinomonadaceae bacterium]
MSTQFGSTKRTLSTGDLVISVSEIFDKLQTTVDPNTLEQLLRDIISERRPQVRPGELITAELINQILAELEALEARIAKLETAGPVVPSGEPVITGLQPSSRVPIQSELRIMGRNFGLPSSNVVTIDGVPVRQFKAGSTDTLLIIDVPLIAGVTEQGKTVILTVSNPQGFSQTSLVIVPAVQTIPTGSLFATLSQSPSEPQLLAGQSYTFVFAVKAFTNMDEAFTLTPTVSTGWAVTIVDSNNAPIPAEIRIPKSDPPAGTIREVRVRVAIPAGPGPGTTAQLKLAVASKLNPTGLRITSGGDTITVGQPPPPPQRVTVSFSAVLKPAGAPAASRDENNVLVIPVTGTTYRVDFSVMNPDPGTYNYVFTPPGGLWTARIEGASSSGVLAANQGALVITSLSAQAGAAPANLILRVVKADDATVFGQFTQPIRLQLAP